MYPGLVTFISGSKLHHILLVDADNCIKIKIYIACTTVANVQANPLRKDLAQAVVANEVGCYFITILWQYNK